MHTATSHIRTHIHAYMVLHSQAIIISFILGWVTQYKRKDSGLAMRKNAYTYYTHIRGRGRCIL